MTIEFRPLTAADLTLLHEWLLRPHVAEWWPFGTTLEEVRDEYGDCVTGADPTRCYIAYADGAPIGFIQAYSPVQAHADGWWLDEHDPNVRGIDQFLANADQLDRGLGTRMIRAFVDRLFDDPSVTRIQTDPDPRNARAIRCYQKVGFRAARVLDTPDGPALLMYCDR